MLLKLFKIFGLLSLILISSCAHNRLPVPQFCAPYEDGVVCSDGQVQFPEANGYLCFKPSEIVPYFERCGKR